MKKSKLLFSLFVAVLISIESLGQDQEVESVSSLFEVFSKLSDNIDKLVNQQEAKRLYRHLDYFKNDLNRYLKVRKEITSYLEAKNYSSFDTLKVQEAVLNLEIQLIKLIKRFELIEAYSNGTLLEGADDFLGEIDVGMAAQRQRYINKLKALSEGEEVDKTKLKNEGAVIYKELQKSISLVNQIKVKVKAKFAL